MYGTVCTISKYRTYHTNMHTSGNIHTKKTERKCHIDHLRRKSRYLSNRNIVIATDRGQVVKKKLFGIRREENRFDTCQTEWRTVHGSFQLARGNRFVYSDSISLLDSVNDIE
jgi:hypothetical protein